MSKGLIVGMGVLDPGMFLQSKSAKRLQGLIFMDWWVWQDSNLRTR